MRLTRAIGVAGLVAVALLLVAAMPASAHFARFARSVAGGFVPTTGPPYTSASGKVGSPKATCRKARVSLWKEAPGNDINYGNVLTGLSGRFTFHSPGAQYDDGAYYLVVKKKVLSRNRFHNHFCPRLKTNSFTITNP